MGQSAALVGLVIAAGGGASAAAQDASTINRKINLAGRQRMLSQHMAMAAFYARLGIGKEQHLSIIEAAHGEFGRALVGLRSGDAGLKLIPEEHPSVLAALDKVDGIWERYDAAVTEIINDRDVQRQELGMLAALNMKVLARANVVVKRLVSVYGGGATALGTAKAIDVAGRQRMLSQKMAKEAALIGLNYQISDNRNALSETAELFDNSLFALMYGGGEDDLPEPPAPVLAKLQEVEALWLDSYPILSDIAASGRADKLDLQQVAYNRDPLLVMMNDAVILYEDA